MTIKQRIKNWCLRNLFSAITSTDFIVTVKGKLLINGKILSESQVQLVARQAKEVMERDHIISLILNDLSHLAHQKIYYENDADFGKSMLYNVNLIRNKLSVLSSLYQKK